MGHSVIEAAVKAVVELVRDFHSGKLEDDIAWGEEISADYKRRVFK